MSVTSYVKDIADAVKSTFEGMSITFSHLFRKPMTIQYPDKIPVPIQETLPHRYRGILEVDLDICTGCLAWQSGCSRISIARFRDFSSSKITPGSLLITSVTP